MPDDERAAESSPIGNEVIGLLLREPAGAASRRAALAAARPAGNRALADTVRAGATRSHSIVVQRKGGDPPDPPITPQSIEAALEDVRAVRQVRQQVTSLRPWDMFAYVPWNPSGGEKKRVFASLGRAYRQLHTAEATLQAKRAALAKLPTTAKPTQRARATRAAERAEAQLTTAQAAVPVAVAAVRRFVKAHLDSSRNPALADVRRRLAEARRLLASARRQASPTRRRRGRRGRGGSGSGSGGGSSPTEAARQAVAAAQVAVTTIEAELATRLSALKAEIDAADYAPTSVERTTTTWAVGDARATLYDKVEAYATITASGLEGKAELASSGGPTVAELLARDTTLSPSTKRILAIISEFEGHFSSLNTWDIADVTWGMVQWTTGASGKGDLVEALEIVKAKEPAAFDTRLRRYGVDVDDDGIVLTRPDGSVLHGLAAAKALQASAQLSAVLAASGADPKIQVAQLKAAYDLEVRKPLQRSVRVACIDGTRSVRVVDVVTSEAGVGALANQTVHGGYPAGAVMTAFSGAAKAAQATKADAIGTWSAEAEERLVAALRKADPERVATMQKRLDDAPGSFR